MAAETMKRCTPTARTARRSRSLRCLTAARSRTCAALNAERCMGCAYQRDMADQRPGSARGSSARAQRRSARRGSKTSAWDRDDDDGPGIRKLGAVRRSTDEAYGAAVEIE